MYIAPFIIINDNYNKLNNPNIYILNIDINEFMINTFITLLYIYDEIIFRMNKNIIYINNDNYDVGFVIGIFFVMKFNNMSFIDAYTKIRSYINFDVKMKEPYHYIKLQHFEQFILRKYNTKYNKMDMSE